MQTIETDINLVRHTALLILIRAKAEGWTIDETTDELMTRLFGAESQDEG